MSIKSSVRQGRENQPCATHPYVSNNKRTSLTRRAPLALSSTNHPSWLSRHPWSKNELGRDVLPEDPVSGIRRRASVAIPVSLDGLDDSPELSQQELERALFEEVPLPAATSAPRVFFRPPTDENYVGNWCSQREEKDEPTPFIPPLPEEIEDTPDVEEPIQFTTGAQIAGNTPITETRFDTEPLLDIPRRPRRHVRSHKRQPSPWVPPRPLSPEDEDDDISYDHSRDFDRLAPDLDDLLLEKRYIFGVPFTIVAEDVVVPPDPPSLLFEYNEQPTMEELELIYGEDPWGTKEKTFEEYWRRITAEDRQDEAMPENQSEAVEGAAFRADQSTTEFEAGDRELSDDEVCRVLDIPFSPLIL